MSTDNFAQSMQQAEQSPSLQQKLAAAPHKEQTTKAEGLDSMTGELEDSELEAVNGGSMWWGNLPQGGWFAGKPLG